MALHLVRSHFIPADQLLRDVQRDVIQGDVTHNHSIKMAAKSANGVYELI